MRRIKKSMVMALAVALVLAFAAGTALAEKPAFKQFPAQVDAAFVKQVVDGKTKGLVIDSRPKRKKYDKGHVPGALSLPFSRFKKMAAQTLPADKGSLVVFYCGGFKCPLSHKSAFAAQAMGYQNIKVYAAGYPDWKKNYPAKPMAKASFKKFPKIVEAAMVKKIVDGKMVGLVIDARPKRAKYDKGHVPGALSIPFSRFKKMAGLLPADKNAAIIFYCGGLKCPLSHKSAFAARAMGYKNVMVFAKGYPVWKKTYGAGPAMAMAAQKPATAGGMLKPGKEEGSVDLKTFEQIVRKDPAKIMIIDVRDPGEFKAGNFATSVNMTADQLEPKLAKWKPAKPVVFVCSTGARSGEAFYMVLDKRPDLKNMVYYLDAEVAFKKGGEFKITPPK